MHWLIFSPHPYYVGYNQLAIIGAEKNVAIIDVLTLYVLVFSLENLEGIEVGCGFVVSSKDCFSVLPRQFGRHRGRVWLCGIIKQL